MPIVRNVAPGAAQDRLEKLLQARVDATTPEAKAAVDRRIWDLFGDTWSIMFTDLAGFSRQVATYGITHFLQTILEAHRILTPILDAHDGILLKTEGDSMLVLFRSPCRALAAALAMQRAASAYSEGRPETEAVRLCVGLGHGDVLLIGDQDVFGAEVNAASKLGEDLAGPGEILVTGAVRDAVVAEDGASGLVFERLDAVPPGAATAWRVGIPGPERP